MQVLSKRIFAGLLVIVISGCVTNGANVGTTRLEGVSDATKALYQTYRLALKDSGGASGAFAYDAGVGASAWATRAGVDGRSTSATSALENCNKYGGKNCKILDQNGHIVWKDISASLYGQLTKPAAVNTDSTIYKFENNPFNLSDKQKKEYRNYLKHSASQRFSVFFVSEDQKATSTGFNDSTYSTRVLSTALKSCKIKSNNTRCYLFAENGKPINRSAIMAVTETHEKSAVTPSHVNDTIVAKLKKLKRLFDEGVITQNDFDKKKEQLLSKL